MRWFAKMIFDRGGGKYLKNCKKSIACLYKFLNITKNFIKKIIEELKRKPSDWSIQNIAGTGSVCKPSNLSTLIPPAGASCRGAILIEFAVCMPILIILLFYIYDLMKLKRWYSQTEFAAQQFVNIIQNISQKRENKRITYNDLRYACYLSYLSAYPGTTMLNNGKGYGFAHRQELIMTYVVGNSDGTVSCKWTLHLPTGGATSPKTYAIEKSTKESTTASLINFKSNAVPSEIYPTLKINSSEEEKIIIESTIMFRPSFARYDGYKPESSKKAFGYFLLNPKPKTKASTSAAQEWHYHSVVIFKPKKNLFSPDPPTES